MVPTYLYCNANRNAGGPSRPDFGLVVVRKARSSASRCSSLGGFGTHLCSRRHLRLNLLVMPCNFALLQTGRLFDFVHSAVHFSAISPPFLRHFSAILP